MAVALAGPYAKKTCTSFKIDNHANSSSLNLYRPDALSDAQNTKALKANGEQHYCYTLFTGKLYIITYTHVLEFLGAADWKSAKSATAAGCGAEYIISQRPHNQC